MQTVTISGSPTGGTFTLTYAGQTTAGIAYNATAAVVRSALEALSNLDAGDVAVFGGPGSPWTVTFGGTVVPVDVALMTASAAGLTGGTSPAVTVAFATTYAVFEDVTARWDGATLDTTRVGVLLGDAHEYLPADLEARLTAGWTNLVKVRMVLVNMVLRVLRNPSGVRSESAGPFSYHRDAAVASGKLWLTGDDRKLLGLRRTATSLCLDDQAIELIADGHADLALTEDRCP